MLLREPLFYDIVIGVSLIFLILTYDPKIGPPFLGMWVLAFMIRLGLPSKILTNRIYNNTHKAIFSALVAFAIFIMVTFGVTFFFQGTSFLQGISNIDSLQSIMRHGFAATGLNPDQPIFANSKFLTYYSFGIVIPYTETVFLISLLEGSTTLLGISFNKFSIFLGAIYTLIAGLFVWLHANVKGVEDNTALLMTFIFAIITFELVRRGTLFKKVIEEGREAESAIWLHIFNNLTFIANRIGL